MAEEMIVRSTRVVVKVRGHKILKEVLDSNIWDYYLVGSSGDDIGRERYVMYMELKKCVKLRQLSVKYGCMFSKLYCTRKSMIGLIKSTSDGWTEGGQLKDTGGSKLKALWDQGRKDYENGDYENIPEWLLKELNKIMSLK